jgi:kynurenine formamidase
MEESAPLLLIEDMHLSTIDSSKLEMIFVLPWQIKGVDSTPCTVLAKMNEMGLY